MMYKCCGKRRTSQAQPHDDSSIMRGGLQKPIITHNYIGTCVVLSVIHSMMNSDVLCRKFIDYSNTFPLYLPLNSSALKPNEILEIAKAMLYDPLRISDGFRIYHARHTYKNVLTPEEVKQKEDMGIAMFSIESDDMLYNPSLYIEQSPYAYAGIPIEVYEEIIRKNPEWASIQRMEGVIGPNRVVYIKPHYYPNPEDIFYDTYRVAGIILGRLISFAVAYSHSTPEYTVKMSNDISMSWYSYVTRKFTEQIFNLLFKGDCCWESTLKRALNINTPNVMKTLEMYPIDIIKGIITHLTFLDKDVKVCDNESVLRTIDKTIGSDIYISTYDAHAPRIGGRSINSHKSILRKLYLAIVKVSESSDEYWVPTDVITSGTVYYEGNHAMYYDLLAEILVTNSVRMYMPMDKFVDTTYNCDDVVCNVVHIPSAIHYQKLRMSDTNGFIVCNSFEDIDVEHLEMMENVASSRSSRNFLASQIKAQYEAAPAAYFLSKRYRKNYEQMKSSDDSHYPYSVDTSFTDGMNLLGYGEVPNDMLYQYIDPRYSRSRQS